MIAYIVYIAVKQVTAKKVAYRAYRHRIYGYGACK